MKTIFNLYFAGSGWAGSDDYIKNRNSLRLLSYHLDKGKIKKWRAWEKPIFLDSGAFSAHTKNAIISEDDYIQYINDSDPTWTCFAQLDTIPGEYQKPKTSEQIASAPKKSWENYLYMVERVGSPKKLLPIFHQGEDFKYLRQMLEHPERIDYIGISPANDVQTALKENWIDYCFRIIKVSSNPQVKTHAFGMTSLPLLERFPFYSADSTSWLQYARHGVVITKYGPLCVSNQLTHNPDHISNLHAKLGDELEEYFKLFGFTLEELGEPENRFKFNIEFFQNWADNYKYTPKLVRQSKLF